MYLLFSCLDLSRIDIGGFESCKQELHWGSIVRVRAREENWDLKLLHQIEYALPNVVGSIIKEDHCFLPPFLPVPIQMGDQVPHKEPKCLGVRVGLQ